NGSTPPETQCPVPLDQQPINEYRALFASFPFSCAAADFVEYCSRLFVTGAFFALLVGLPVAFFGSAGHQSEPVRPALVAASSGLFVVTLAIVRMYMGWSYVGNRLLSVTVEYEETGWYDGQMSKSTPSDQSRINLLDPTDVIANKIKRCKTDSFSFLEFDNPERPECNNLLSIYQVITSKTKQMAGRSQLTTKSGTCPSL
ncbi:uncharacterized protein ycf36-like, partial [Actinidia eriantha]|uniref:uncharacterized protein ycf36-like n=1 Tax=Actinidia eriantha TaxID=165200 RepID=UPI00258CC03A